MALISKGNDWLAGFCTALAIQLQNSKCEPCYLTIVKAAKAAKITLGMAKEVGVDNFDIQTLRRAGIEQ